MANRIGNHDQGAQEPVKNNSTEQWAVELPKLANRSKAGLNIVFLYICHDLLAEWGCEIRLQSLASNRHHRPPVALKTEGLSSMGDRRLV